MLKQKTLKNLVRAVGIGLHSGRKVELVLRPAVHGCFIQVVLVEKLKLSQVVLIRELLEHAPALPMASRIQNQCSICR